MDNKVNDLAHENKFKVCLKNIIIIIQRPRHFFAEAGTKKRRYASAKASAFADCKLLKLIKNFQAQTQTKFEFVF